MRWHGSGGLLGMLVGASLFLACKVAPTTVLLQIRAGAGVDALDELRLSVLTGSGVAVKDRRLPPEGRPTLPGEVVLYPPGDAGTVRILVRGLRGGSLIAEGATVAPLVPEAQATATVTLAAGGLPDRDRDGVPDSIDNCPDLANPAQGPCATDARVERADAGDGPSRDADLGGDLRSDQGPLDCLIDADCDDENLCTSDACVAGLCSNPPANEGGDCDDKNPCTTDTVCASGLCGGGSPVSCPPPTNPCKQASCDPSAGCVTSNRPNGTPCSDGLFCTNPDTCTSGVCGGPPRDCSAGLLPCHARSCNEVTNQCVDSPLPNNTPCDDKDPCTQGEQCQQGSCTPPPLRNELVHGASIGNLGRRSTEVDSAGAVHTVFHDDDAKKLLYATNKTGSWVNETIASGDGDFWPSLCLDGQGNPHVAFIEPVSSELRHTKRGVGSWSTAVAATAALGPTSITVGSSGTVHMIFTRGNNQELHHAVGPPFQTTLLGTAAASSYTLASSLCLDGQGKVHVVSNWTPTFRLQYFTNASGAWAGSDPASGTAGLYGIFPSIAIGATGNLYVSHQASDSAKAVVYLTTRVGASWQTITAETVAGATGSSSGRFTTLVLDSQEKVHIGYRNAVRDLLRYVTNRSGSWVGQDLDTTGGNTGRWPSIARAPSGTIHLTYERDGAKQLRHIAFSACP